MTTRVRQLESEADPRAAIREAAECLAGGGLVAFPTETVYGLAASAAHDEALARLREVKQRSAARPFTVHLGGRSAIDRFVPDLPGVGRRLIEKAWPGPLTLIFEVEQAAAAPVVRDGSPTLATALYHDGTIGLRCPDDPTASALLSGVGAPVVAASANPAGEPPPVDAEAVSRTLDGKIDLLLDGGRTRYGKASTIVRVNDDAIEILRTGVLDERTIRKLVKTHFLLVCSGNTCRSPMAAGLLRRLLAERIGCDESELGDRGIEVESAGTGAFDGARASETAVRVMKARGIDIAGHRSQGLTVELLHRADHVYAMTEGHRRTVRAIGSTDATRLIDESDVTDPIGGDDDVYEDCADRIERGLRGRLEEIQL